MRLRLVVEGAEASTGQLALLMLPWDTHGPVGWVMDGPPVDGWCVTYWASGRSDWFGVAIRLSGHYDAAAHPLFEATSSVWRGWTRWFEAGALHGDLLPIVPTTTVFARCKPERSTLGALATLLATRTDLRARLAEPDRMARLAADISRGLVAAATQRVGARRDTTDIIVAMRQAGYLYPFGRPLAKEQVPPEADVLMATRARLDANRYREGRNVDDETILRIAHLAYLDVAPWPFAALVDD